MYRQPEENTVLQLTAKIIPLHPGEWLRTSAALSDAERGRHFLKVTLPAIPIVVFTLTFLFGYAMNFVGKTTYNSDPTPALIGAFLITMLVCLLCAGIYSGFRQVAGLRNAE